MKVPKVIPVVPVSRTTTKKYVATPVKTQYQSEIDPAVIIHSSKTHRTASEAFRDADYATPIWRCETDWDRTKQYLGWIVVWAFTLSAFYIFALGFEKWVSL
jgi:hypothetical protein